MVTVSSLPTANSPATSTLSMSSVPSSLATKSMPQAGSEKKSRSRGARRRASGGRIRSDDSIGRRSPSPAPSAALLLGKRPSTRQGRKEGDLFHYTDATAAQASCPQDDWLGGHLATMVVLTSKGNVVDERIPALSQRIADAMARL